MSKNDGGPAFPARPTERMSGGYEITAHHGMSLRDYFAGQALASMLASPTKIGEGTPDLAAELSYKFADGMLAAREAK